PPRFFLRRPAPGGGQWQVQAPCHQTECRLEAVGKNRQKSLDEIPDRFPARCLKRLLSQNLVPQLFAGGDRAADRGCRSSAAPTCTARRAARRCRLEE